MHGRLLRDRCPRATSRFGSFWNGAKLCQQFPQFFEQLDPLDYTTNHSFDKHKNLRQPIPVQWKKVTFSPVVRSFPILSKLMLRFLCREARSSSRCSSLTCTAAATGAFGGIVCNDSTCWCDVMIWCGVMWCDVIISCHVMWCIV